MPRDVANYFLKLNFATKDHARYRKLSKKAQDGSLTENETAELDDLLTANDILMILQSQARISMKKRQAIKPS